MVSAGVRAPTFRFAGLTRSRLVVAADSLVMPTPGLGRPRRIPARAGLSGGPGGRVGVQIQRPTRGTVGGAVVRPHARVVALVVERCERFPLDTGGSEETGDRRVVLDGVALGDRFAAMPGEVLDLVRKDVVLATE